MRLSCLYLQGLHIERRPTSSPTYLCFKKLFLIADSHCVLLVLGVGPSLLNYNSHLLPVQEIEMVFGAQLQNAVAGGLNLTNSGILSVKEIYGNFVHLCRMLRLPSGSSTKRELDARVAETL